MNFKIQIVLSFIELRYAKWRYDGRIEQLQMLRWKKLLRTLLKSPYYRDLAIKESKLSSYPLMNKTNMMLHFDKLNTEHVLLEEANRVALEAEQSRDFSPTVNHITVGLSSGTSGNRGIFLASNKERAMWVASVLDRVIGFSLKHRKVAFFLRANSNLYGAVQSKLLKFEFFDLMIPVEAHIGPLNELNPHILVAQPSLLLELAKMKSKGLLNIKPTKIISVAEVLYPEDEAVLKAVFEQTIHQVYQCTEGFLASTCKEGTLHFNEDFLIIEKKYLDENRNRYHPIITDLLRHTQPIVRYELNDIIHEKKHCPCGSHFSAIDMIEGRSDDILRFKNIQNKEVSIFPDFFRKAIMLAGEHITQYTLVQTLNDELELYTDGNMEQHSCAEQAILSLLSQYQVFNIRITKASKPNHILGNKLRRIRNDYKTN